MPSDAAFWLRRNSSLATISQAAISEPSEELLFASFNQESCELVNKSALFGFGQIDPPGRGKSLDLGEVRLPPPGTVFETAEIVGSFKKVDVIGRCDSVIVVIAWGW